MITGLFCFTYEVAGHCQNVLIAAETLEAAEQRAEQARPEDWTLVETREIPLPDLLDGVALPWF
jgi:hypothetical protein